jgi:hypothetical protein
MTRPTPSWSAARNKKSIPEAHRRADRDRGGAMNAKEKPPKEVQIMITEEGIDMGEKYAYGVSQGSQIKWTCSEPFAVQFDWDAPFSFVKKEGDFIIMETMGEAKPIHPYKYTVAVSKNGKVMTLDPVIIVIPPRR